MVKDCVSLGPWESRRNTLWGRASQAVVRSARLSYFSTLVLLGFLKLGFGPESFEFCESMNILKNVLLWLSSVLFLPRLVLEFSLMSYAFGQFPVVVFTWWAMFLSVLSVPYFIFQRWARGYRESTHPMVHTLFHGVLFVVFQFVVLGFGPTYIVLAYKLPPASRCIVIFEQVRFCMWPSAVCAH